MRLRVRKGFSSLWESREQLANLLPEIASAGFDGIEPTFAGGAIPSPAGYLNEAPELRRAAREHGLEVPSMRGGRLFWDTIPSPDPRERDRALEHAKRALECLSLLGGDTLLVVPGRMSREVGYRDHWSRVVEFARRAGELAEPYDITIGLENVEARFPLSVNDWESLLEQIDRPNVRMYFDVGNVLWLGLGYPEQWIAALAKRICSVHFKDAVFAGEIRHLLAGEVDWRAVVLELANVDYHGWICVEPEWYRFAPHRLPRRLFHDLEAILRLADG